MKLLRTGGEILASRVGQAGVNALCGLLIARALGPVGQGHYSLTVTAVLLVAALANGGMGLAAVPPLRQGGIAPRRMLRAQAVWILLVAVLIGVAGAAAWRLGLDAPARQHLGWDPALAAAALLACAALLAFDIVFYDLLALGRLLVGPLTNLGRAVLHLAVLATLAAAGALGLAGAVLAYGGAQLAAAATAAALVFRERRPGAAPAGPEPGLRRVIGRTLRAGWVGQLSSVASLLHLRLDLALVAAWHGAAAVGVYSVAVLVGELLWLLPNALQPVMVFAAGARGGADAGERDRDRLAARAVRIGLATTAVAAAGLALFAKPLLTLLFPPAFAGAVPALRALLPGIVVFAAGSVLAGNFIGRGRPAWNTQASGVTVAVNVVAGLLLIPRHGIVGAAWASTLAYAVGSALMVARFRRVSGLGLGSILRLRRGDFLSS